MTFAAGLRLHDRYTLVELIGVGGMSEVWRAVDEVLDRLVAVKALASTEDGSSYPDSSTWREARAAARLTHPHVTQVYDYGEQLFGDGSSVPYLVMELVDGRNLAARLGDGPLPWPDAVRMAAQVAAGLASAHRLGVVHRDVKPGNVMLTPTGAKVLDFGIAALAGRPAADAGWLVGTPAYAAPEQLRPGPPDPAADVYALGALLFEALTGEPPIPVLTWEEAEEAHRRASSVAPPMVPGLPSAVAALCLACLATDPDRRPSAQRVAEALNSAASNESRGEASPGDSRSLPATPNYQRGVARAAAGPRPRPATAGPPTAISRVSPEEFSRPDVPRRRLRPSMMILTALLLVGGLSAAIATAALNADTGNSNARGNGNGGGRASASPPAATSAAPPSRSPQEAIQALDSALESAIADGRVDDATADDLRDGVEDLRRSVLDDDLADVEITAASFLNEINNLADTSLDPDTRQELTLAISPLLQIDGTP
jgi:serine/threonine-protein kinase